MDLRLDQGCLGANSSGHYYPEKNRSLLGIVLVVLYSQTFARPDNNAIPVLIRFELPSFYSNVE
jgi:hypothetical protein